MDRLFGWMEMKFGEVILKLDLKLAHMWVYEKREINFRNRSYFWETKNSQHQKGVFYV